jgi:spermidine synthase
VIPWVELGSSTISGSENRLRLMQRGNEYSIMTGGIELMNSRMSGSEQALATLTCARLKDRPAPRLLIGGLGMGFTLRAALEVLPALSRVEVGELLPAVIDWARGPMAELFSGCLDDRRVVILEGDVAIPINAASKAYDAILLDVDNGPGGLDRVANDGLYRATGLAAARRALKPGGILAVWSAMPDEAFLRRMNQAGFTVTEERVHAHRKGKGARHVIWLGVA